MMMDAKERLARKALADTTEEIVEHQVQLQRLHNETKMLSNQCHEIERQVCLLRKSLGKNFEYLCLWISLSLWISLWWIYLNIWISDKYLMNIYLMSIWISEYIWIFIWIYLNIFENIWKYLNEYILWISEWIYLMNIWI